MRYFYILQIFLRTFFEAKLLPLDKSMFYSIFVKHRNRKFNIRLIFAACDPSVPLKKIFPLKLLGTDDLAIPTDYINVDRDIPSEP